MAANRRLRNFARSLEGELNQRGFKTVNAKRINRRLMQEGLLKKGGSCGIVSGGEKILNRGIGAKRSGFNVFVREEPQNGRVLVYYMNPDSSEKAPMLRRDAKGRILRGQNYNILKIYKGNQDPTAHAEKVAGDILQYASLKYDAEYRMESHVHSGRMFGEYTGGSKRIPDDGMSSIIHVLRVMAHTNRDVVALTSHNAFDARQFRAMEIIAQEMGMVMVPSVELTIPGRTPNGPHVCCYLADAGLAMNEFKLIALRGREDYSMPPFNDVGKFPEIVQNLFSQMVNGTRELFMAPSHPFNFYTSERKLYEVGILSSIESGPYSFEEVTGLLPYFQGIEGWNFSMSDADTLPNLKDRNLREYVHEICATHLPPGTKRTPNSIAYAFALQMQFDGIVHNTFTGTDDHYTPDMNYRSNGLPQVRGHTEIELARVYSRMADRKPTSNELISWLLSNQVFTTGFVYLEHEDGYLRVPKGRKSYDRHTSSIVRRMEDSGMDFYKKAVLKDLATFNLNPREMGNLMHSYGIGD
jgi:hypothetical protein